MATGECGGRRSGTPASCACRASKLPAVVTLPGVPLRATLRTETGAQGWLHRRRKMPKPRSARSGCAPAGPRHAERVIPCIRLRYGAGGGARGGPVDGHRSEHVSFSAPSALIEAAKRGAGVTSTPELCLLGLSLLAQPDPVVSAMRQTRGRLGSHHQLEY